MNALVESLLAPAPEVDPEDATNFDDGTAARTSTGFKAGDDLAVIPKRRLVDAGDQVDASLAKSSRAELFDDGLDSGDDDVVADDYDDVSEEEEGQASEDQDYESDAEPQATGRQTSVFAATNDGVDDLLNSFDAEDSAGVAKAAEKAPAKTRAARCARAHAGLEADVLEFRVLLEGALRAAAKVEPGQGDPDAAAACQQLCAAFLDLLDASSGVEERERDIADADALWEDLDAGHRKKRPKWEAATETWRRKTHLGAAQASMGLKATNLGPFEQARLAAQDDERARKKMYAKRPEGSADVETYDDTGLYKAWLRDYASRGVRSGGASAPKQRQSGAGVCRGSKGRGLRFKPHEKLTNFMYPEPRAAPPVDVDMLVSSLFK